MALVPQASDLGLCIADYVRAESGGRNLSRARDELDGTASITCELRLQEQLAKRDELSGIGRPGHPLPIIRVAMDCVQALARRFVHGRKRSTRRRHESIRLDTLRDGTALAEHRDDDIVRM